MLLLPALVESAVLRTMFLSARLVVVVVDDSLFYGRSNPLPPIMPIPGPMPNPPMP
jgi:hypothetical protein